MRLKKAFTLVEVLIVLTLLTATMAVILSLTKITADSFQSGLRRFDFANQARQLNIALMRDCTGPTYWQILDNFTNRSNSAQSSGSCLVLAYTNNLNNITFPSGPNDINNVKITRVVCYYWDTSGAAGSPVRALRRIDSAESRAGVIWPINLAQNPLQLPPGSSLAALLPAQASMSSGAPIGQIHIGQSNDATSDKYQLFYARTGGVTLNALLRYGNDYESFIAPVRFTVPVVR